MKIVADSNSIEIFLPKHYMIDFDALKFVGSKELSLFSECIYSDLKSHHKLIYRINNKKSIEKYCISGDDQLLDFIFSLISVAEECRINALMMKNVVADPKCVFAENGLYKFTYLPVEQSKDISVKNLLLKFLKLLQYRSEKYDRIIKVIKRSRHENCVKNTLDLIREDKKTKDVKKCFHKYKAICLPCENECETTLLRKNTDNILKENEYETTILSYAKLMNQDKENSFAETTLLLKDNHTYEPETSILTNNSSGCDSYYGETNLLNYSADNEIGIEGERTNRAASIDMPYLKRIDTGQIIYITKPKFIIGKNSVVSDYCINNASVSRNHASIICEENNCYVVDNDSTNGTIVEGVRISPYEKTEVFSGAIISFSGEVFQFFKGRGSI